MRKSAAVLSAVIGGALLLLLFLLPDGKHAEERERLAEGLFRVVGITTLAVAEDCTSTRGVIEGIWGCLGDVPGGYCYHSSCDVQATPCITTDDRYRMEKVGHGN